MKRHLKAVAVLIGTAFVITACAKDEKNKDVALPPPQALTTDAHVIVVRHAYPACSDIQCDLNDEGYRQADELARLLSQLADHGVVVAGVYASGACRTVLTATPEANAAGVPVSAYPPRDDLPVCAYLGDGDDLERPTPDRKPQYGLLWKDGPAVSRDTLMAALAADPDSVAGSTEQTNAFLIVDHSNFVCEWFKGFDIPDEDYPADCGEEGLAHTDYADIYWMYKERGEKGARWRLVHYENAFDRGIPNAYEQ